MDENEQLSQEDAAFMAAFESDFDAPAEQPAPTEAATDPAPTEGEAELTEEMVKQEGETEVPEQPGASQQTGEANDDDVPAADVQRAKSWEGRLKAREAELKAREDAIKAKEAAAEGKSKPVTEEPSEQQVEEAMESVKGMDEDEALKSLAEDFGEDFAQTLAKLIERKAAQIAEKAIGERVGKVDETVQSLIGNLENDKARSHYETIADAHPDFMEIAQGDNLAKYVKSLGGEAAQKAQAIVDGGSARQVIKLLNDFKKAQQAPAAKVDDPAVVAAEGVRSSGGMKIPERPAISNDYAAAWDQF